MSSKVKRTYASRSDRPNIRSSSPILPAPCPKRKRPFDDFRPSSAPKPIAKRVRVSQEKTRQTTLKQLHFCIDQSVVKTCSLCQLAYTKGAEDDEALHRAHCAKVQRGMGWGREEEREKDSARVKEIQDRVRLKDGKRGRIICMDATLGGRIGTKLSELLETINVTLAAPPLSSEALRASKAYLFLLPDVTPNKEQIVGCIIAQRIEKAMAVAPSGRASSSPDSLIAIDHGSGLFCYPEPLPTALGISRIFVTSAHRRKGIAGKLLSAAADTFVHGCILNPKEGQVAFSQTTGDGMALMRNWGQGGIRIYDEDDC
ncbi:hypothetical protein GYMLUDRAFT_221764 [Collybiopsis luxurians FD-317 M1]|uniref:N-acetyltransferase ECO1 n=1 Tax=Collybiopsis luxurians FD-317 M1 TaxID=944289 RepID=A0A0D0BHX5_9AGAR|nr:hypothetical protein GYMLUDRAFT_221764 [Collybiopsis luxurians FD-317 M1]